MAFMECHFHSEVLGMASTMNVILPQAATTQIGLAAPTTAAAGAPVLYLLHGLSDDHSTWARRTAIERHVAPLGLAVVMPCVHRSFYANMVDGYRYWDFVADELPAIVGSLFRVSERRCDTFVAGLSMGGYGAFKLALRRPEQFAAAGSLSGALDLARRASQPDNPLSADLRLVFGTAAAIAEPDNNLLAAADRLGAGDGPRPLFYQCCGTEDFLYQGNLAFRDQARKAGLELVYEEGPGTHEWGYWDVHVKRFLELLVERGLLGAGHA